MRPRLTESLHWPLHPCTPLTVRRVHRVAVSQVCKYLISIGCDPNKWNTDSEITAIGNAFTCNHYDKASARAPPPRSRATTFSHLPPPSLTFFRPPAPDLARDLRRRGCCSTRGPT